MLFVTELLKKEWVRYTLVLVLGVAIGAIFYPTKNIEEKISKKYQEEIASLKETHSKEVSSLKETYDSTTQSLSSKISEKETKISSLSTQIKDLKSKQKTAYYKLIKPDGTIEIKKFSESEVSESTQVVTQIQQEFKEKITQVESKYQKIHAERVAEIKKEFDSKESGYKKKIEELESSKTVTINQKKFGAEVGANTEKQYYIHGTGTLFGPVFVGAHAESNKEFDKKSIGLGLGISF